MKKLSFPIIAAMILMLLMIPAAHAAGDDINPLVAGFTVCGNDVLDIKSLTVTKDELQAGQADIAGKLGRARHFFPGIPPQVGFSHDRKIGDPFQGRQLP